MTATSDLVRKYHHARTVEDAAPDLLRVLRDEKTQVWPFVERSRLDPRQVADVDELIDWALGQEHDPERAERIERDAWGER